MNASQKLAADLAPPAPPTLPHDEATALYWRAVADEASGKEPDFNSTQMALALTTLGKQITDLDIDARCLESARNLPGAEGLRGSLKQQKDRLWEVAEAARAAVMTAERRAQDEYRKAAEEHSEVREKFERAEAQRERILADIASLRRRQVPASMLPEAAR